MPYPVFVDPLVVMLLASMVLLIVLAIIWF